MLCVAFQHTSPNVFYILQQILMGSLCINFISPFTGPAALVVLVIFILGKYGELKIYTDIGTEVKM